MALISGIYKDNDTDTPDYIGCSDEIIISDKVLIEDERISQSIDSYMPESMRTTEYDVFTTLMKKLITQVEGNSNFITECYNLDSMDEDMIYKVSSIYDINYPLNYNIERLKLLFKNYEKIRKERGIEKSLYMLFRILERTEEDLYANDADDTVITKINDGMYQIHNSRIRNINFAMYMCKKVTRTGLGFIIDTRSEHRYTMSAVTTIYNDATYDSVDDDEEVLDDLPKTAEKPLITDRKGYIYEIYDY